MKYQDILEGLKKIYREDFTMDAFRELGLLNKKINEISIKQDMNNSKNEENYYEVKKCLEDILYLKLKDRLGFEDEIINKIIDHIGYAEDIQEIYVLDGYVAFEVVSKYNELLKPYFVLEDGFCNITSNNFNDSANYGLLKKLIVESINNVFKGYYYDIKPLELQDNGEISCIPNINVYVNSTVSHLGKMNDEVNNEICKLMIKDEYNNIYYFDMKLRDGYLVLSQNEYDTHKVSELLNKKKKIKSR